MEHGTCLALDNAATDALLRWSDDPYDKVKELEFRNLEVFAIQAHKYFEYLKHSSAHEDVTPVACGLDDMVASEEHNVRCSGVQPPFAHEDVAPAACGPDEMVLVFPMHLNNRVYTLKTKVIRQKNKNRVG